MQRTWLVGLWALCACGAPPAASGPSSSSEPTDPAPAASSSGESTEAPPAEATLPTPTPKTASDTDIKGMSEKIKFVSADTPFGGGKSGDTSFFGLIFRTQPGATSLPDFSKMRPIGALFTNTLEVGKDSKLTGFPGVDKARTTDFALRYEAKLNVGKEADYHFRIVSDDGAKLMIDDMVIVDNDGVASAGPKEAKGGAHLVKATHLIRIDYFQAQGDTALQVFVTPAGGKEAPLKTNLF